MNPILCRSSEQSESRASREEIEMKTSEAEFESYFMSFWRAKREQNFHNFLYADVAQFMTIEE